MINWWTFPTNKNTVCSRVFQPKIGRYYTLLVAIMPRTKLKPSPEYNTEQNDRGKKRKKFSSFVWQRETKKKELQKIHTARYHKFHHFRKKKTGGESTSRNKKSFPTAIISLKINSVTLRKRRKNCPPRLRRFSFKLDELFSRWMIMGKILYYTRLFIRPSSPTINKYKIIR